MIPVGTVPVCEEVTIRLQLLEVEHVAPLALSVVPLQVTVSTPKYPPAVLITAWLRPFGSAATVPLHPEPHVAVPAEQIEVTIVIPLASDPVTLWESVAVMVKDDICAVVGVPVIAPVEAFSDKPVGNEPEVTAYVYAAVPPDAVTVWLYAVLCVPFGSDPGDNVRVAVIVTE